MPVPQTLLTLAAAATLVGALAGPAAAASDEEHADARKDVVTRSAFSDDPPRKVDPSRRLGDIMTAATSYGTDLVVTTRFRNLQDLGHQEFHWWIRTPASRYPYEATLVVNQGQRKGRLTLLDPDANNLRCASAALDRTRRSVTLTVPGTCVGEPETVRVGSGVLFVLNDREFWDDARIDGAVKDGWKYGPSVTRALPSGRAAS